MNITLSNLIGTLRSTFKIGRNVTLDASAVTIPRTLTFPDKSGTIATTADVGGGGAAGTLSIPFWRSTGTEDDIVIVAGTSSSGTATLSFSTRSTFTTVTVSNAFVATTSRFRLIMASSYTTDHNIDEHALEDLSLSIISITPGVSFTIAGFCRTGTTHGTFKVYWEYV